MSAPVEVKVINKDDGCFLTVLIFLIAMNSCSMRLDMMDIKHYLKEIAATTEVPNEEPS